MFLNTMFDAATATIHLNAFDKPVFSTNITLTNIPMTIGV